MKACLDCGKGSFKKEVCHSIGISMIVMTGFCWLKNCQSPYRVCRACYIQIPITLNTEVQKEYLAIVGNSDCLCAFHARCGAETKRPKEGKAITAKTGDTDWSLKDVDPELINTVGFNADAAGAEAGFIFAEKKRGGEAGLDSFVANKKTTEKTVPINPMKNLHPDLQAYVEKKKIEKEVALVLGRISDQTEQLRFAKQIIEEGLDKIAALEFVEIMASG